MKITIIQKPSNSYALTDAIFILLLPMLPFRPRDFQKHLRRNLSYGYSSEEGKSHIIIWRYTF